LNNFAQISHVSDDRVPSLSPSSGAWKVDTIHRARVTGYFPFDGLLQLSLRPSILEQNYLQVGDVQVGELIKGTIKKLTESGLFVSISENVDGVVWPNHYADIALKHPSKRFKPGASIKCRVSVIICCRGCRSSHPHAGSYRRLREKTHCFEREEDIDRVFIANLI
jgi:rRNA biogenesis protein RRP5